MIENLRVYPGRETFDLIKASIIELRKHYDGLITFALPSNTSPIFLKKQVEEDLRDIYGIRFYSQNEIISILQDGFSNEFVYRSTNHVTNIIDLKNVSDKLFSADSSWKNIVLVEETLKLLNGINQDQIKKLKNINYLAYKCINEFQKIRMTNFSDHNDLDEIVKTIFGKIIILTHEYIPDLHELIIQKCNGNIAKKITMKNCDSYKINEIITFESAFDEANAILDLAVIATENTSLNKLAIVVPNNRQKQLLITCAETRSIPISGSITNSAYSSQVVLAARYILENKYTAINKHFIDCFYDRFHWLKTQDGKKDFYTIKDLFKNIQNSTTLKEYYTYICKFLENGYNKIKLNSAETQIEFIDNQYSILKELCKYNIIITPEEADFLLKRLFSSLVLRIETIGNGIYICNPKEIIGNSFDELFITSMNAKYLNLQRENNSLLSKFDVESIIGNTDTEITSKETNKAIINWLFNCSNNITVSTSEVDITWKKLHNEITIEKLQEKSEFIKSVSILDAYENDNIDSIGQTEFYESFFSDELNENNLLIERNSISNFSATSFEILAKCPFKYFITRTLKASHILESEDIDLLKAIDRGNMIHKALEDKGLSGLNFIQISKFIEDNIIDLIKESYLPNEFSGAINKIEILDLIETCLVLHKQAIESGSNIYDLEKKVKGKIETSHGPISITGTIDRIDSNKDKTYTIIDYKSGELKEGEDFFMFGQRLQLGIYASLLEKEMEIKLLEYWYLKKNSKEKSVKLEIDKNTIDKVNKIVDDLTSIISKGIIAPRNYSFEQLKLETKIGEIKEVENCKNCEVKKICYMDHQEMWQTIKARHLADEYCKATIDFNEDKDGT